MRYDLLTETELRRLSRDGDEEADLELQSRQYYRDHHLGIVWNPATEEVEPKRRRVGGLQDDLEQREWLDQFESDENERRDREYL